MEQKGKNCPLCDLYTKTIEELPTGDGLNVQCPRCGDYLISNLLRVTIGGVGKENHYILSALSRELTDTKEKKAEFTNENIDEYLNDYLIPDLNSVKEKAKKLLQRLRDKSRWYGEYITILLDTDQSLAYAKNPDEFIALISFLDDSNLIEGKLTTGSGRFKLTAEGWDITNDLKKIKPESDQGFVAIWFDDSMNKSIKAIMDAIEESNYKPLCIKKEHFSEKIIDKAMKEIRRSKFIIADLTGDRSSVFLEVGFAFGLDIDVIFVYNEGSIKKGSPLEFYVKHYQCHKYKNSTELKEKLKDAIGARIKNKS